MLEVRLVNRYGLANSLAWLKDRRLTGRKRMDAISPLADQL
jgi:hypothetical protein